MFELFAFVFLIINGTPSETPALVLANHTKFESIETCRSFISSPEGQVQIQSLETDLAAVGEPHTIQFVCKQKEGLPI